jgi:hypothetical protein
VAFSASSYSVSQSAGSVSLTVTKSGTAAVTVQYATGDGTAVAGADYTAASGSLNWATGDSASKTITVPVSNVTPFTGSKEFGVALSNPSANAELVAPSSATVTVAGDATKTTTPPAPAGNFQFTAATYKVDQNSGSLPVMVSRTGGSNGAVAVAYATSNGSAAAGTDYTAANGTLNWASGDATVKTFSVVVGSDAAFVGTKSFNVTLSSPSGGASLGSPSSASITITGSGVATTGAGAPSAVTNLLLTNQGGPNVASNNGASSSNSQSIAWGAATAGAYPIAHYQIYRNGSAFATVAASNLTYTDNAATNSNDAMPGNFSGVHFNAPRTIYTYNVAAVDTQGNVGPQAPQMTYWEHHNGVDYWGETAFNDAPPAVTMSWSETSVVDPGSPSSIEIKTGHGGEQIQPSSGAPSVPMWSFESGAFVNGYMEFDVYPTVANQTFKLNMISRVTVGDLYNNAQVTEIGSNPAYGPAPMVQNQWNHYKVPMGAGTPSAPGLQLGVTTFQGYISGNTLTVTSAPSDGMQLNPTFWVSGPGMTTDYVVGSGPSDTSGGTGKGGTGTYTMSTSQNVGSAQNPVTFTAQRTNCYKWSFHDQTSPSANTWYMDNIGYTTH